MVGDFLGRVQKCHLCLLTTPSKMNERLERRWCHYVLHDETQEDRVARVERENELVNSFVCPPTKTMDKTKTFKKFASRLAAIPSSTVHDLLDNTWLLYPYSHATLPPIILAQQVDVYRSLLPEDVVAVWDVAAQHCSPLGIAHWNRKKGEGDEAECALQEEVWAQGVYVGKACPMRRAKATSLGTPYPDTKGSIFSLHTRDRAYTFHRAATKATGRQLLKALWDSRRTVVQL